MAAFDLFRGLVPGGQLKSSSNCSQVSPPLPCFGSTRFLLQHKLRPLSLVRCSKVLGVKDGSEIASHDRLHTERKASKPSPGSTSSSDCTVTAAIADGDGNVERVKSSPAVGSSEEVRREDLIVRSSDEIRREEFLPDRNLQRSGSHIFGPESPGRELRSSFLSGVVGSSYGQDQQVSFVSGRGGLLTTPLVECFEVETCDSLSGHVRISGAKNSALAVLAGALCSEEPLLLRMVPDLHDVRRMCQVLRSVGVRVQRSVEGQESTIAVDASCLTSVEPCPDTVRKLRASFFVIGALMGRQGEAVVPLPGGCNIGARPINLHVRGLEALGAHVEIRQGRVHARACNGKRLVGGSFCLDYPSVGATETLMMAAALADGETCISNVAQEPEVVDLADFLVSCGAKIRGAGTNTLVIEGVRKLHGTDFTVIPDRIEAGTFLVAAAITRSTISMSPVIPFHLTSVVSKLRTIGCRIHQTGAGSLQISAAATQLRGTDVTTLPYPGFPTDLQPQLMSLLTCCHGSSVIKETVFESRMRHVEELQKLGAMIKVSRSTAIVSGKDQGSALYGAPVTATDLRAGAALVLAGMAAEGVTHIEGVSHIDRGYEQLDEKLRLLGAKIQRLPCLPAELNL